MDLPNNDLRGASVLLARCIEERLRRRHWRNWKRDIGCDDVIFITSAASHCLERSHRRAMLETGRSGSTWR